MKRSLFLITIMVLLLLSISPTSFAMVESQAEIVYPSIEYINIDSDTVILGNNLRIYAKPNFSTYGTNFIAIEYLSPSSYYTKTAYLYYNISSKLFEDNFEIEFEDETGLWKVMKVRIYDNKYNSVTYFNNEIYTIDDVYGSYVLQDLSWIDFTVQTEESYYFDKGLENFGSGNYEDAIMYFDKAIDINPNGVVYYLFKSTVLMDLKRYEEVIIVYDQIIELYPNIFSVFNNKGYALIQLGRYLEALEAINQGLILEENNEALYKNKGLALTGLKRYNEALLAFDRSLEIDPTYQKAIDGKNELLKLMDFDLNIDGVIDVNDLMDLSQVYGSNNDGKDLNNDNVVDIFDLVKLGRNMKRVKQ